MKRIFAVFICAAALLCGCGEPSESTILQRAEAEVTDGHPDAAIKQLEDAYAKNPQSDAILEALAMDQFNSGDPLRAGELLNTLALRGQPDYHLYAAASFKKAQNLNKAIESYRLFLLDETKQASVWDDFGETLIEAGQTEEGIEALKKAHQLDPSVDLALRIATLSQNTSPTQTQRYLQSALKQAAAKRPADSPPSPIEGDILAKLADLAIDQDKLDEATRHYKQLNRDFPNQKEMPQIKAKLKELVQSELDKRQAQKQPLQPATVTQQAPSSSTDETPSAPQQPLSPPAAPTQPTPAKPSPSDKLMQALEEKPTDANRWAELAYYKAKTGDYNWAEAAYLEALRRTPNDPDLLIDYMNVVAKLRTPRETLDEAENQLTKHPDNPDLYLFTARMYADPMQNARNASILYREFIQKFPKNPQIKQAKAELAALPGA